VIHTDFFYDRPKFFICQQASLGYGTSLDLSQNRCALFRRDGESEFFAFQVDAVEPALFPQHDAAAGIYQVCGIWFDGFGDVKLGGNGAALAHEEILPTSGFQASKV